MNSLNESRQSPTLSKNLQQFMRQHPLFSFFFMAYAFSWIILMPYILSQWGVFPNTQVFQVFFALNAFAGPTLSAIIMTRIIEGKAGLLNLRKRLRLLKVGWRWYVFILLGLPVMMLLGIIILPGALSSFSGLPSPFLIPYIIYFIAIFFGGGPLAEEIGWRGFSICRFSFCWSCPSQ